MSEANPEIKDPNEHVLEYLRYYCDPSNQFDFAVMLKGEWGAGKTFFIKKFISKRDAPKPLYVSLYGLTSFAQIDNAILRESCPPIARKGMKIIADSFIGAAKEKLGVDLAPFFTDDDVGAQKPKVKTFFEKPSEHVIVFDDLERCAMPTGEVLGYMNALVEHEGFKVIILAYEKEIQDCRFQVIKEKLVGQTLEVNCSPQFALPEFLSSISHERTRKFLTEHVTDILQIFRQSGTQNLRVLKQSLWTFERLANCFSEKHWERPEAIGVLLSVVLALSFQIRTGALKVEEFPNFQIADWNRLFHTKKGDPDVVEKLEQRYPGTPFNHPILSADVLKDLLFNGWIDPDKIKQELDGSTFFAAAGTAIPWKTVWSLWEVDDATYLAAVADLENQFKNRVFENPAEVLQVFSLRLMLSKIGLIPDTKAEVESQCRSYVDYLRGAQKIRNTYRESIDIPRMLDFEGFGFISGDEFDGLRAYFADVAQKVKEEGLPNEAEALLELLKTATVSFFRSLCTNGFEPSPYWDIPILAFIQPDKFVSAVLGLDLAAQRTAFTMFRCRYDQNQLQSRLQAERDWIVAVRSEFKSRSVPLATLPRYRIEAQVKRSIDPLLPEDPDAG